MGLRSTTAALALSGLLLAGCGDDGAAPEDPGPSPAPGSASTGSADAGPTGPTGASVPPADGVRLELPAISVHAVAGWEVDAMQTDSSVSATSTDQLGNSVSLSQVPDPADGRLGLRRAAELSIDAALWLQRPRILEPVELDGVEVYHVSGRVSTAQLVEEFGATVDGQGVSVQILLHDQVPAKERREIVRSILATVEIG